jgi:hypothetical protein
MIINPVEISESDEEVKIQSLIEYSGKKKYLWYSIPKKFSRYLTTEKLDGFLVGVLLLAMRLGEDVNVKGAVSEKLYFNLTNSYMRIVQCIMPALKKVNINPQYLDDGKRAKSEGAVATGFSGGVDSFCTIYDHYLNEKVPSYKITHLVFLNVGSHGEWDSRQARELFNARYNLVKGYASEIGLEFIKIDSNLSDVLRLSFQHTYVPRNISAILLLQKLFSKYYVSSSYRYEDCVIKPHYEIGLVDPMAVHLLSTETLECISTGSQYSRVEKTKLIAKIPGVNRWLNVCVSSSSGGKNCSVCMKCCRTLLTLEMLGILENFDQVFNLDKWKKVKTGYLIKNLGNKEDQYIREIREYAKSVGYLFNPWQMAVSEILNFKIGSAGASLSKFIKVFHDHFHLH